MRSENSGSNRQNSEKRENFKMNRIIKLLFVLPIIILVAVVVIGVMGKSEKREKLPRPTIGEPARDFTFPGLDGREVSLSDFYGKKVVFLNVWATWCTSCKKELPTVQKMYEKLKGDDFEVLAISIDTIGKKAVVPFMKKYGLTFPALLNTTGSIQLLYGTTGVPESFIIDKKGTIAYIEIGPGDWREPDKQSLITGLMSEPDLEVTK
jgi:peroxiredoxin